MRKHCLLLGALCVILVMSFLVSTACSNTTPSSTAPAKSQSQPTTSVATTAAVGKNTITLKAVSFLASNQFSVRSMVMLADQVNKRSNGELTINYLGGPEVLPAKDQPTAVQKGVMDITICPTSYYAGLVPLEFMPDLSELTPEEEYKSGAYDYMLELHKKAGLYFLGRAGVAKNGDSYNIITKKLTESPQQLAGQKIGTSSLFLAPILEAYKATAVNMANSEFYSALQTGLLDGINTPIQNIADSSLFEVTKYLLQPGYYKGDTMFIMNLASWNKLSPSMQTLMTTVAKEAIQDYMDQRDVKTAESIQKCVNGGMKVITFSDADAKQFIDTANKVAWDFETKKYPDIAANLKKLLSK